MKKKSSLVISLAVLSAFAIGLLVGISIDYPRMDDGEVAGTIRKVNNYRNTKASEADIQLKNELKTDSVMLKHIISYMNFFYVRAVEFGKNIDFSVTEANANDAFKSKNTEQITALENYGKFLFSARKDLLIAIAACYSIEQTDPVVLRDAMVRANNLIAQMNYRNHAVISFINVLDSFVQQQGPDKYPGLSKAHDLLTCNMIGSSLVLKNEVLLNYFDKKKLHSKDIKPSDRANLKETVKQDMESLGLFDAENLGLVNDAEGLGMVADMEVLSESQMDAEILRTGFTDSGMLSRAAFTDVEKLGVAVADMDELSDLLNNN